MSQMTHEAPSPSAATPSRDSGGGNVFKRKLGPLPMWVWLVIGIALIGGYVIFKSRSGSSGTSGGAAPGGTTSAAQVPQFVNQTYTTVQPPVAPQPVASPAPTPTSTPTVGIKTLTATKAETLNQFAKEHNWTATTLAAVEKLNNLKGTSKLKKGQKVKRPWAPQQPGQPADTG
jgi:hypothetical protein